MMNSQPSDGLDLHPVNNGSSNFKTALSEFDRWEEGAKMLSQAKREHREKHLKNSKQLLKKSRNLSLLELPKHILWIWVAK